MSEASRFVIPSVNTRSKVAVFTQIENEIRFAIASGKLKAGGKLPSVREVSETLGINPNTVAKAYRDLEVMGLVYTRRGMGVWVKDDAQDKCRRDCAAKLVARLHEVAQEAQAMGIPKSGVIGVIGKSFASKSESPYGDVPGDVAVCAEELYK